MKAICNGIAAIAVPMILIKLHLRTLVLSLQVRELHLIRGNCLGFCSVQLIRLLGLQRVAKYPLRDTQFVGHNCQSLAVVESLYEDQVELRHVHLFRYREHAGFRSFPSNLDTTDWRPKFRLKLNNQASH